MYFHSSVLTPIHILLFSGTLNLIQSFLFLLPTQPMATIFQSQYNNFRIKLSIDVFFASIIQSGWSWMREYIQWNQVYFGSFWWIKKEVNDETKYN